MAKKEQDLELDVAGAEEGGGKKSKKMVIIGAVVLLLVAAGVASFLMFSGDKAPSDGEEEVAEVVPKEPAKYIGVPESLTSNIPGTKKNRTIQIKMSFMVRGTDAEIAVKTHMPQLKNDILMLISQQSADELATPEGRVALQEKSLETVQATLTELSGAPSVEKVLFISFVMQ